MTHAGMVLAQDARVGLSWDDAWVRGMPLLVTALGTGVGSVSDGAGA
jgi:hypothetical protein